MFRLGLHIQVDQLASKVHATAKQPGDWLPTQFAPRWCRALSAPHAVRHLSSEEIHEDGNAIHLDCRLARCVGEWRFLHTRRHCAWRALGGAWHERSRCQGCPGCPTRSHSGSGVPPSSCLLFRRSGESEPKRTRWHPPRQRLILEQAMEASQQYSRIALLN